MQTILNTIDHGMGVAAAVNAPRVHHQHLPDVMRYEKGGLRPATVAGLEGMGHTLKPVGEMCDVQAIAIGPDGLLTGAADPRGWGVARGF
jgi:gamma-glutamyltranspeptidase/glutathione hydrolase